MNPSQEDRLDRVENLALRDEYMNERVETVVAAVERMADVTVQVIQ
ncbi:MAG: hypothetical protein MUF49_28300 [Oculatellaceae cyanobacterium Prado106]|nr:hypothetical protein [Oculatellaceae cyanobacterium Prado106]